MSNKITNSLHNPINLMRLDHLHKATKGGPVLILTHNNPDPDALASGLALAHILIELWGVPSRLMYSGLVARAENKAMLRILVPEWEHVENPEEFDGYSAIALVDTQPGAGNNRLTDERLPDIVIDHHHPIRDGLEKVPYIDMRPDVGATVSLLYQHLETAELQPDLRLATAMFYGLQTDTQGLSRGASPVDQYVYFKLLSMIDHKKLIQVERAGLPRDYYRAFNKGLEATKLFDHTAVAYLGLLHRPDFVAEMADLLIRLEMVRAVMCLGHHENILYLSLRTEPSGIDAGNLIQQIIIQPGKAGGHGTMAGGQVNLSGLELELIVRQITDRFLKSLDETSPGEPLLHE